METSVMSLFARVFGRILITQRFLIQAPDAPVLRFRLPNKGERIQTLTVFWTASTESKHRTICRLMQFVSRLASNSRAVMHRFNVQTDFASARKALETCKPAIALQSHRWLCVNSEKPSLIETFAALLGVDTDQVHAHGAVVAMRDFVPKLGCADRQATDLLRAEQAQTQA